MSKRKVLYTSLPDEEYTGSKLKAFLLVLFVCSLPVLCIALVLVAQGKLP